MQASWLRLASIAVNRVTGFWGECCGKGVAGWIVGKSMHFTCCGDGDAVQAIDGRLHTLDMVHPYCVRPAAAGWLAMNCDPGGCEERNDSVSLYLAMFVPNFSNSSRFCVV